MKTKVAHLTSHHNILDNRIFYRECRSLAAAGYEVVLVAPHDRDEIRDGVQMLGVPRHRNRLQRVTLTAFRVVRRALREQPAIFHFHDPELIFWGLMLRLLGKKVIYDVHEDFTQAAGVRPWVPDPLRPLLARFSDFTAWLAWHSLAIVIAERYYARTFPGAVAVLNYANLQDYAKIIAIERAPETLDRIRLLYTGSITRSRGAAHHLRLLDHLPATAALHLIGQCNDHELVELEARRAHDRRLQLTVSKSWIPYGEIVETYAQPWTAGLAIFPDTPHYREKELTKFFEYMAAGLPIVCSNFPVWRALVEDNEVGICVDPEDPAAAAAAIRWLTANPKAARCMGERGRRLVQERFHWHTQAQNLLNLYDRLLGQRHSGSNVRLASHAQL